MSCVKKISEPVEMNIDCEKYYYFMKNTVYHIPNITSTIQNVSVHEGDWDNSSHESIKVWNYNIGAYENHPSYLIAVYTLYIHF